jgi:potassium-dependent mechanosensitive channel
VIVLVVAAFMVFAPWGVDSRDAMGTLRAIFFGVQVGGFTISLSAILLAVAIFSAGLIATRAIQRWLDTKYLPSTRMDAGLRNSIRTTFGYLGFIIAAMFAFSALGIDVQNLAIVAGALSVGIGFGLQSIVSNFVSGLILLAERPVKQGDLIAVGESEGYVRRINVRSTEIETFDKAVLIVPNANLVSGTVKNWMHNDHLGRARIKITVAKGPDPEAVSDMLLAIMTEHPSVLRKPSPKVFLIDFAGDGFVFEMTCVIGNVEKAHQVRSELRFAISRRFRDEGIELK